MAPTITWLVNDENVYDESYIGSYESTEVFTFQATAINNYLGLEPVDDIKNSKLLLSFKDYEDSVLLEYLRVSFDGGNDVPLEIVGDRAYAKIPRMISGDYVSPKACTLDIKISISQNLAVKSDLKQLFLDIVY